MGSGIDVGTESARPFLAGVWQAIRHRHGRRRNIRGRVRGPDSQSAAWANHDTMFARTSTRKKGKILCPDYYVIRGTLAVPLVHEFMYLAVIGLIF